MDILNPIIENPVASLTALVTACSALSAVCPSLGRAMKVVDFLALNFLKARNDSRVQ